MPTIERAIYDLKSQTPGMFPDSSHPPFTMVDMKKVIENFDPEYLKPPVHHGHPKSDATDLALGTITGVRLDGSKLMATMKLDDTVKEDFDDGKLLAHSAELYRNLDGKGCALRGLGLLGATPPRQKNLPSLFSETDEKGDYDIIVFSDNQEPGEIPMPEPIVAQPPLPTVTPAGKNYTDEQIDALIAKTKADALAEASKSEEFAEATKAHEQLKKDNEQLQKDLDAQRAKDRKADHEAFAESDKMEHATPIQKTCAVALLEHLDQIEPSEGEDHTFEAFAEDGTSVKFSPRELIVGLTKPAGEAIKKTLSKPHARSEKSAGSKAGDLTVENFAEHEATKDNLQQFVELFCEENPGTKKGDAYVYISGKHPEWLEQAGKEQD